jgi:hypothetical protein
MKAKLNNFLQSDVFILSVALFMGFLCHFFVTTEILASDKQEKDVKSLYASAFNFEPVIDTRLQSIDSISEKKSRLSTLLESNLNISMHEDDNYKYVDIESSDEDNKSLKIDIHDNLINIQKEFTRNKLISNDIEKAHSPYVSSFNQSLSIPNSVDLKNVEIIKLNGDKENMITIKFPKLKFSNS